jgi:hypothetical protein
MVAAATPQRVGKSVTAALPPDVCAFGDCSHRLEDKPIHLLASEGGSKRPMLLPFFVKQSDAQRRS